MEWRAHWLEFRGVGWVWSGHKLMYLFNCTKLDFRSNSLLQNMYRYTCHVWVILYTWKWTGFICTQVCNIVADWWLVSKRTRVLIHTRCQGLLIYALKRLFFLRKRPNADLDELYVHGFWLFHLSTICRRSSDLNNSLSSQQQKLISWSSPLHDPTLPSERLPLLFTPVYVFFSFLLIVYGGA